MDLLTNSFTHVWYILKTILSDIEHSLKYKFGCKNKLMNSMRVVDITFSLRPQAILEYRLQNNYHQEQLTKWKIWIKIQG